MSRRSATGGVRGGLFPHSEAPRIMVADDELEMRMLLELVLRKEGYEVLVAADGWDVMSQLLRRAFAEPERAAADLLLVDFAMPGCSGLQVLADLAGRRWRPPIVMITGSSDQEMHKQARELGAVEVLHKPFELDELRRLVSSIVGGARQQPAQAISAAPAG
jgi:DNA-binding response OmpR family regulator